MILPQNCTSEVIEVSDITTLSRVTCTWGTNATESKFVVPADVSNGFLHVALRGADGRGGGGFRDSFERDEHLNNGGNGALVTGKVPVVTRGFGITSDREVRPGEHLYLEVGGRGGRAGNCYGGSGGWNGGADGGADDSSICGLGDSYPGGGGGGASDIQRLPRETDVGGWQTVRTAKSSIVVAGGGGGGGGQAHFSGADFLDSTEGAVGGNAGQAGKDGAFVAVRPLALSPNRGGGPGTSNAGGHLGHRATTNKPGCSSGNDGPLGGSGELGHGGDGTSGYSPFSFNTAGPSVAGGAGGGGGGGLYGGGGGGGGYGCEVDHAQIAGAGGGGGSSLLPPIDGHISVDQLITPVANHSFVKIWWETTDLPING